MTPLSAPDMAIDDSLQNFLADLAVSSDGRLEFRATTANELAAETGLEFAGSRNPIYEFRVAKASGERYTCIAFTLFLDGSRRPATRVEALGKSLADSDGRLFALNPLLLVFDYTGNRLLGVSAIELFHAFATRAATRTIPYSGSSLFSLSPSFQHSTINMYAEVSSPAVWAQRVSSGDLPVDKVIDFLDRVVRVTQENQQNIESIIHAINARINAAPERSSAIGDSGMEAATASVVNSNYVNVEDDDSAVSVDDRLWRVIQTAIASSPAVLLVGPPGTGKTALLRKAIGTVSRGRQSDGLDGLKPPLWSTPDESWTARELIGGETVIGGEIVFRPGWILRSIAENRWLVLDEANRADLDRIFGALLTWLAGGSVTVGVESAALDAKLIELSWADGPSRVETTESSIPEEPGRVRYLASRDEWRLLGTYNALDAQRVFRIGAALGRRFARVPIPPLTPAKFVLTLAKRAEDLDVRLRTIIGLLYRAHYDSEVTRVGPAQFLGMCGYLRAALARTGSSASILEGRSPLPTDLDAVDGGQSSAERAGSLPEPRVAGLLGGLNEAHDQEAGTSRAGVSSFAAEPQEAPTTPTAGALDLIVSEAYVLSLGTFLAQLEEPDLKQLMDKVRSSEALSESAIEWVTEMTRALA